MPFEYEREFFDIRDEEGERFVKYLGCTYAADDEDRPYRSVEVCWCTILVSELLSDAEYFSCSPTEILSDVAASRQQYIADMTEDEVRTYIEDTCKDRTYLEIDEIDRHTLPGQYWCAIKQH